MIVAITGGNGFIGSALVARHIGKGDEVRVLTRRMIPAPPSLPQPVWFHGNLHDTNCDLKEFVANADVLYHCAGEIRDPARMQAVHVGGTRRLLEHAAGNIGRWVQLSSVGVYGPQRDGLITEETACAPVGPYETTKAQSDDLVLTASQRGDLPAVILRPSNVISPDMTNRSFFQLIAAIRRGLFFYIGPPGASANYVHRDNVADALVRCGTAPVGPHAVYNLSDHCTFEQLVHDVCNELQCSEPRLRIPEWPAALVARAFASIDAFPLKPSRVNALTNRSIYSIKRISDELGYVSSIPIREAVRQMAAAWRSNVAK